MKIDELREELYEASMHVEKVLWLGGMYTSAISQELLEFIEFAEPEELIDLFGPGEDNVGYEYLGEGEYQLAAEQIVEENSGFLVICEAATPRDIKFNPEGEITSWSEGGVYWIINAYGDSLEEATRKALRIREERFEQEVKKQREASNAAHSST